MPVDRTQLTPDERRWLNDSLAATKTLFLAAHPDFTTEDREALTLELHACGAKVHAAINAQRAVKRPTDKDFTDAEVARLGTELNALDSEAKDLMEILVGSIHLTSVAAVRSSKAHTDFALGAIVEKLDAILIELKSTPVASLERRASRHAEHLATIESRLKKLEHQ